ncbi:hypothetical protein XENOCAPTIV_025505 [Xenoophorus captivus]|uniref:Mitochondrial uncoupling protein 2 n=1 Tax=Xenoophorus captivus TaxID=1517983 RepID=A0ABV0S9J6_9TELE
MVVVKPTDVVPSASIKFFGAGTAACIADLITFPLDTAKVRLQGESQKVKGSSAVKYRGVFGTINTMVRTEGARSLYNGLVAGLQRQMSFASVRIGLYDSMKQFYTRGTESAGIVTRLMAGCTTGAMAVAFAQPTDVVKVQGEASISEAMGKGPAVKYRGVFGTIITMVRTEGPLSLYSGLVAGLQRQMSFASVRIGLYDSVKQFYTKGSDHAGIGSRLLAGCTTGGMAVALAQPTDVVKVRFQAQARSNQHARRYCGTIDAYKTIAKEEGIRGLWKGNLSVIDTILRAPI